MPSETPARAARDATASAGSAPPLHDVTLSVNGEPRRLAIEPRQVLLDVLRDELGLCGTKKVCTMGNCGACTVHLDGRPVYSCLVLGVECDGREIGTIEGLADGDALHPVQQAFVDCDAYQCGFCTPGQIMSLAALVDGDGNRGSGDAAHASAIDDDAILRATSGNLCRCGAYRNILKAGRQAVAARADADADAGAENDDSDADGHDDSIDDGENGHGTR